MNWLRVLSIRLSCCGVWSNLILQRISQFSHAEYLTDFLGLLVCERYVHNGSMIDGSAGSNIQVMLAGHGSFATRLKSTILV
jgi:hypothetical protein